MPKLLVDASILLRFYDGKAREFRALLKVLKKIRGHLFITRQVADEVRRNRLAVCAQSLLQYRENLTTMQQVRLPEHLGGGAKEWNKKRSQFEKDYKDILKGFDESARKTLRAVQSGRDEISSVLEPLLESAVEPEKGMIERARERRELGIPPGKPKDPLGDQLTWIQYLDAWDPAGGAWIVTRDEDYFTPYLKTDLYLNAYLYAELRSRKKGEPSVYLFDKLSQALAEFRRTEKPKLKLPKDDVLKRIEEEERMTPSFVPAEYWDWASEAGRRGMALTQSIIPAGERREIPAAGILNSHVDDGSLD